ncbi:hypothetical protein HDU76_012474 [Blyttiomyces sp. JEL0837]|nr:hypothetical protein HDU76_012474 [Blyttiomyces sp. JEL0837]
MMGQGQAAGNNPDELGRNQTLRRATSFRSGRLGRNPSISKRSYISNLSFLNRTNLARFGRSKIVFLIFNSAVISVFVVLDGLVGFLGAFTHRKSLLVVFCILLWPALAGIIGPGYMAYKEVRAKNWENTLSSKWDSLVDSRNELQQKLDCCGFDSYLDRPFVSDQCPSLDNSTFTSGSNSQANLKALAAAFPVVFDPQNPDGTDLTTTGTVKPAMSSSTSGVQKVATTENLSPSATLDASPGGQSPGVAQQGDIPSCRDALNSFYGGFLVAVYSSAFAVTPFVLLVFIVGLLATNHVYDD